MGDRRCNNIPELLQFYRVHFIETTVLKRPVDKKMERVRALYDYESTGNNDLGFEIGDFLFILDRGNNNKHWLTARNMRGDVGFIPVDYVEPVIFFLLIH